MTRKRKIFLFCLLPLAGFFAVLLLIGLVRFVQEPGREIGKQGVAILSSADRVETFRLNDNRVVDEGEPKEGTSGDEIADYPLKSQGHDLGPQFAAKLSQALTDPRTFIGPNDVTCEINPGVAFRVWH